MTACILLLAGLAAGGQAALAQRADPLVAAGQRLVEVNCSRCHAIGRAGISPHADAPPFHALHKRYPVESLAEALAEGITTGHRDMPEFVFAPKDIDALIAYLKSLE